MHTKTYRPAAKVTLYREANDFKAEDISDDICQLSTNKGYGLAAGGWEILTSFKRRFNGKRYDEVVKPDDIILIQIDGGFGEKYKKVMFGLVDRPSRYVTQTPEGIPVRQVKIVGMDFGKIIFKHNVGWDIAFTKNNPGNNEFVQRLALGLQFSGKPATLCKSIINTLFQEQLSLGMTSFVYEFDETDDWETFDMTIMQATGSVWTVLQEAANMPFNSIYTDTKDDGNFWVILEKNPFDNKTGKLIRPDDRWHKISNEDIVTEDIGISDVERYNFVYYETGIPIFGSSQQDPIYYVNNFQYDEESIKRHGFLQYRPKTNFYPRGYQPTQDHSTATPANILTPILERAEIFWNWYKNNHEYESGTLQINSRPEIRVGDGLINTDTGMEYFIENVSHHMVFGEIPSASTTLKLTRGQKHGSY